MCFHLSFVKRKVAEFYHSIDRRRYLVWLKWLFPENWWCPCTKAPIIFYPPACYNQYLRPCKRDSSEDFEGSCFVMASYEDLHRSKIWTFTLFFCAISKERRYMKGYLKERMTYKRILEKKRHLLTDNCELCDKTWGAPVTHQDELWCVHLVLRFFIQSFIANTCIEQWRYLAGPSSNSKLLFQLFLGRLKYG